MRNLLQALAIAVLLIAAALPSPAVARFFQTDPAGSKDDPDLYSYVGNDPTDRTDPSGLWLCSTCDKKQRRDFDISQGNARRNLAGRIAMLKAFQAKLATGGRLSDSEKVAAADMDKYLGKGAGTDGAVVDRLLAYAGGMMNALNSSDAMEPGAVPDRNQIADFHPGGGGPNSDTLSAKNFFSMDDRGRQQTIAHETARAANYRLNGQDTMIYGGGALPGGEAVSAFGADNIARIAAGGIYDPLTMLDSFPDASTSALGFR